MQNYISAEEFLKQSGKVQKVLLEWWVPANGNIFYWNKDKYIDCVDNKKMIDIQDCINLKYSREITPLLQMHQLIQFIEDKTNCKVQISLVADRYYVELYLLDSSNFYELEKTYEIYEKTRLETLWKVACEIAEEDK